MSGIKHQTNLKSNMTTYIAILVRAALKSAATSALLLGSILPTTSSNAADDARDHLKSIKHIIVIYQENWSFDSLYGQFPGADGYANSFDTLISVSELFMAERRGPAQQGGARL